MKLHPGEGQPAAGAKRKKTHPTYPLLTRTYDLKRVVELFAAGKGKKEPVSSDVWEIGITYDEEADHYVGMDFSPEQRVSVALRLFDDGAAAVSPQAAVQSLPISRSMVRLSGGALTIRSPVRIKARS